MTWGSGFVNSLDLPSKTTEYALRFIGHSNDYFLGAGATVRSGGLINIGTAEVTIDNARITPQRWSVNFGGFSIAINGDLRPIDVSAFRKGAIAELYMRRDGVSPERVAIGQLRAVSGVRGVWRLEFGDFISAMTSRLSTKKDELNFYYNAGKSTTVSTNYNFSSDPNLYLADITIFEKDTNFDGMILVTDAHGRSEYYKWSSKTTTSAPAGYLTISSTGSWPSTSTTLTTLQSGDKVVSLTRLQGKPHNVFARTLMSTGNTVKQGSFDDYPQSWGVGINFNPNLINAQDMGLWYDAYKTASGSHEVQFVIDAPQPSGIRYLLDQFLSMGMWPVFRQGRISWRVCQDPENALNVTISSHIKDEDIIAIESHSIYSPSQSVVYAKSSIVTSSSGGTELTTSVDVSNVKALPANDEITRDHKLIYRIDSPAQSGKATVDLGRLAPWDQYTYEELTLAVHERYAGLVAGDIIAITSSYIYGFKEAAGKTYRGRRGMILGVRWLPSRSRCILSIGILSK